ncbi:DUF3470 domain-containing protein [Trichodesmium erythraeum 21-75]|nr:DUF3470 domain-containing protein [Trichodesmium erythraeum 21-75]
MPKEWEDFISLNEDLAGKWKVITEKKDPLLEAEKWAGSERTTPQHVSIIVFFN